MNAKYVVLKYTPYDEETIFIFPDYVVHGDFVKDLCSNPIIISAGFVALRDNELFCHGDSISLGARSRPAEDGELANRLFGRIR